MAELNEHDAELLAAAVAQLERPGLAARLAGVVGTPVERLMQRLPEGVQSEINSATEHALTKALSVAAKTLDDQKPKAPWNLAHKVAATASGVAGGMFGAPALVLELPITTMIILRSIGDIARSKGEKLSDPETRLACLEVFALGSGDDRRPGGAIEVLSEDARSEEGLIRVGYFVTRAALAQQVTAAAEILTRGSTLVTSSAMTRLISTIAQRFGIAVSEKVAAQAVPIVGAVGGGIINALFVDHFQNTADAHFTVRMLERKYGADVVKRNYERIARRDLPRLPTSASTSDE
jgi:hypothetical protein